jgi:oligoribonuclease NrnB/cAMP/cGMP phosphodiesterase (DHH superfamily)
MKPLIIYHGNCADGFTAAWLANMAFHFRAGNARRPDDWVVDHHAGVYNETPPDVTDREVYILDFSYSPEVLVEMAQRAKHVTMIDHHATAIKALEGFSHPNVSLHLSEARSGAYLTAQHFWPEHDPPEMVQMVDDRDRWVFANPKTKPFHAALFSRPYAIGEWNRLSSDINVAVGEGRAVERFIAKQMAELVTATKEMSVVAGWTVPVANLPYTHASDAGQMMLDQHPDAPFAATWYGRHDGKLVFSLRSRSGTDVDVGAIAKQFGGGGHKHASGFATNIWPT